jgi:hypothetical protein
MIRWAVDSHLLVTFGPISSSQRRLFVSCFSPHPTEIGRRGQRTKTSAASRNSDRHPPLGRHFFRRDRNSANATMRTIMPKTLLSFEELRSRAFEAIKQYDGCEESLTSRSVKSPMIRRQVTGVSALSALARVGLAQRRELRFACRTSYNTISTR